MSGNNGTGNPNQPPDPYLYSPDGDGNGMPGYQVVLTLFFSVAIVVGIVWMTRYILSQNQESAAVGGAAVIELPPSSCAVVVVQAGPLVCTYRKADGWKEATCPVCLSDMEEGEVMRVLPECMHYFHAACVDEWLCRNATCPVCRAGPAAPEASATA